MRTRLLATVAATLLVLAGCQGDSDDKKTDTSALQKRLSAARTTIDEAETLDVSLTAKSLPNGVTGLLSATGQGNHSPAFKGKVKVVTGGSTLTADVVSAEGTLKAKTSFSPLYLEIDPESLQAPDPAALLDPENGVTRILEQTKGLEEGEKSRDGSDVLTTITGTLPGSVVSTIIPSADDATTFNVAYRLTEDDELRDATLTGPFYPEGGDVTYIVKLATSDKPVTIKVP
ncbi:MAG: LppX_LprAFG lipoprotein [Aeromicrobium sp.]